MVIEKNVDGGQQLRICMLSYSFYESDNRVRRYAEALAGEGALVDVVSLRRSFDEPVENTLNGVRVHRIQSRLINEKGKWVYLKRLSTFFIKSALFLSRRHLAAPYDLIHVHSVPDFEVFAAMIPKLTRSKVILDIHDIVPEFYASKFGTSKRSLIFKCLLFVEKMAAFFSDHILISNHIWEKRLVNRSVPKAKCSTILNYPDEHIFKRNGTPSNKSRFIMIYPGTLNWHQGLDIAIEAFDRIKDKYPHVDFHIYGDGPSRPYLKSLVDEKTLSDRILFKGAVSMEEIAAIMSVADLGIIPKRNDAFGGEAFSTKTLEFMQLGVPIIVSETRIDRYYFTNHIVRFFNPEDAEDLSEKMGELIENESDRKRLSLEAAKFVSDNRWGVKKRIYLDLVHRLVGV